MAREVVAMARCYDRGGPDRFRSEALILGKRQVM